MRAKSDVDAEAWVLSSDEGQALLAEVSTVPAPGPAHVEHWRTRATAAQVTAAIRLAEGCRRAAAKFTRADRMWVDRTGLEQATSEPVARHKAQRFRGRASLVVDLCCGIGGDTLALAEGADVIAVDLDDGMCRRTRWNAGVYGVGEGVAVVHGRAESLAIRAGAWVHIDPDRRAIGQSRAKRIEDYAPGTPFLRSLARTLPAGAIKLGPASDFEASFGDLGVEFELVSLDGECKEATAWFGALATCRRRATCLPAGATWTDRVTVPGPIAPVGPVQGWVFDPDPALLRAGLIDSFATVHGLTRIAAGIDYLTGPEPVATPFLVGFEVVAVLPLDLKRLRRELTARGIGALEIKSRGVDLSPEQVRARLRLKGDERATVLMAGGYGAARAIVARRTGNPSSV
jgi:hypothetical protein